MRALLIVFVLLLAGSLVWFAVDRSEAGDGPAVVTPDAASGEVVADGGGLHESIAAPPSASRGSQRVEATGGEADASEAAGFDGPTRAIAVQVTVQQTYQDDAERAPGLGFVVGMARSAAHAEGPVGDHKLSLARGVSGENGEARVVMRMPEALLREWGDDVRVWGHVAHPGKRAYVRTEQMETDGSDTRIKLFPRGGATLFGRVVRADGTPAHPAEVQLFPTGGVDGEWVSNEDSANVDAHGGFQLDADEAGVFDVQVTASGQGSAGVRGVTLADDGEAAFLELVLTGDGVIEGVLRDPAGAPVPRYRLWCAPVAHREEHVGYLHDPQRVPFEWGGGLYGDHGVTDEHGRFRFAGLKAGDYVIRGHTAKTGYYEELLTEQPVATGTLDLELRFARHRVLARVIDHAGERVEVEAEHRPGQGTLPMHALYIEECDATGRLLHAQRYSHETRPRLDNGDVVLDVQPGKSYVLGVLSRECALVERRFDVTPGDYEEVIVVQLPPPAPDTILEIQLLTPDGEPFEEDNGQRLYAPDSGRLLWSTSRYHDESTIRLAIGPGRYRWEADAEPTRGHHGERWSETPYAPVADELTVLAGRENRFERSLSESGRLSLLVESKRSATGPDAFDQADFESLGWLEQLRVSSGGAAVRLERDGSVSKPAFNLGRPSDIMGESVTLHGLEGPWVAVGKRALTVDPIPPGRYRLVVELDGLGTRETTALIRADEVTEVTVSFDD